MTEYKFVLYEPVDDGRIVRIMLNRPDARNAQNRGLLVELNDAFLNRVVPAILATTTEVNPQGTMLEKFLVLNGDLRRKNADKIASFAAQSAPEILWGGVVFHPFTNTAVESASRLFDAAAIINSAASPAHASTAHLALSRRTAP